MMRNRMPLILWAMATGVAWGQTAEPTLCVGTSGGPGGRGGVYRHLGGTDWENLTEGQDLGAAVMDLEMFEGSMYAATQSQTGYGGWGGTGRVWRYDGGTTWTPVGDLGTSAMVLLVMEDKLYCGVSDMTGNGGFQKLYRYDGEPNKWTLVGAGGGHDTGFRAGLVTSLRGKPEIFLGELNADVFHRYSPETGLELAENWNRSCVYAMKEHEGAVYAGCWHGSFYGTTDGAHYETLVGDYTDHLWALETFQGKLYAGSGRGSCEGAGRLMTWDGERRAMSEVRSWPAGIYSEGVSSLAATDSHLYVGLGVPEGYYSGNGVAEVWSYDGASFERICSPDFFGGSVQSMLTVAPQAPRIAFSEARVIPSVVKPGGTALVVGRVTGCGVATDRKSLNVTAPAGWTLDAIEAPAKGRGVFATAVAVPCGTAPGNVKLRVRVEGKAADGTVVASEPIDLALTVAGTVNDPALVAAAETAAHLRGYDRNLEDAAIAARFPSVMDLSAHGVELPPAKVSFQPTAGTMIEKYTYTPEGGTPYVFYWRDDSGSTWMYNDRMTVNWTSPTASGSYQWDCETRAYASYAPVPPPSALGMTSARLRLKQAYAYPSGAYGADLNLLSAPPGAQKDDALFADAGDEPHAPGLTLEAGTPVCVDAAPVLDRPGFGLALNEDAIPYEDYDQTWTYSGYTYVYKGRMNSMGIERPALEVEYRLGFTPAGFRLAAVEALWRGNAAAHRTALTALNRTYGKSAEEWGFVPRCAEITPLILAKKMLTIEGNAWVAGNAHSDGNAVAQGKIRVDGTLSAVGKIRVNGRAATIGRLVQNAKPLFPTLQEVWRQVGRANRAYRGRLVITEKTVVPPVIYVQGDVVVTGNANIRSTIIATGNVTVAGKARVTAAAGGWAIYTACGRVRIEGTSQVQGRVAGCDVTLSGTMSASPLR